MRYARYILVLLFVLYYRGLSAQEFDLYDFRYYKRFSSEEELLAPKEDSIAMERVVIDRYYTTRTLDYNFTMVRHKRGGIDRYRKATTLNGVELPYLSSSTIRALQLSYTHHTGISERGFIGETELHIDTLHEGRTSIGVAFSSRNIPYNINLSTSQKLGRGWSLSSALQVRTGKDIHIDGVFGNALNFDVVASKKFKNKHLLSLATFINPSMRSGRLASTEEAFRLTGSNLYNPAWGYQNGKVRNSRISRDFSPTAFIGYEGEVNKSTKFSIAATTTVSIKRYSSLDWFDAQTPAPDNYRYMPSYFVDEDDIFSTVVVAAIENFVDLFTSPS